MLYQFVVCCSQQDLRFVNTTTLCEHWIMSYVFLCSSTDLLLPQPQQNTLIRSKNFSWAGMWSSSLTIVQMNPEKRTILPSMAFRGFASRYRRPQMSEGFQDIKEVAFRVCSILCSHHSFRTNKYCCMQFVGNQDEQQLWSRHWT